MGVCGWSYGTCNDVYHCFNCDISFAVQCTEEDRKTCKVWLDRNPAAAIEITIPESIVVHAGDNDIAPVKIIKKSK